VNELCWHAGALAILCLRKDEHRLKRDITELNKILKTEKLQTLYDEFVGAIKDPVEVEEFNIWIRQAMDPHVKEQVDFNKLVDEMYDERRQVETAPRVTHQPQINTRQGSSVSFGINGNAQLMQQPTLTNSKETS